MISISVPHTYKPVSSSETDSTLQTRIQSCVCVGSVQFIDEEIEKNLDKANHLKNPAVDDF